MTPAATQRGEPVLPRYGEASLCELLPSVLGALGVPGEHDALGLPRSRGYVVLVVDGLGWNLLRANPGEAPFLGSLRGRTITAGTPSTTATSLTSLGTGLPPGRHGVLGYTTRVPGSTTALLNALKWEPPVDPIAYQPHPTVFERAASAGVSVAVVGERKFRTSGLTNAGLRSPGFLAADTYGERIAAAARASTPDAAPSLVYLYDGDLDSTGHRAGCASPGWRHQLVMADRFAEELRDALPGGVTLVVTADHGMVDVDLADRVDVDDMASLRDGVVLVGGEARFRHVYTESGAGSDVQAAWRQVLGERAQVLTREQAVAAGWFGAVENRVLDRIGDVVAAVHGHVAVERRTVFPLEAKLVGLHGGLTADEMLVPLLVAER
ncbi:MAG: alkaline phosphatase family protein [Jiangellaceae bacterium]|nr:alkaline phosphatase family protein [Jiangellaceae bacterium]